MIGAPINLEDTVPIFHEDPDDACSICQNRFIHDESVCRLSCRHVFHAECWTDLSDSHARSSGTSAFCPNCRGSGTLISAWSYIDHQLVTQTIDADGNQAPNLMTSRQSEPQGNETSPSLLFGPRTIVQGDVGPDFRPLPFFALAVTTDDVAAASLQNIARLANGRPSLIVDPGSVGNLCGSKWAKEVA